jgi:hypothetical protein
MDDGLVGLLQRRGEEPRRVGKTRFCFAAETRAHGIDGNLRRDFALQVATHAVGDHHQHGVCGCQPGNTILIDLATADAGFLCDRVAHYQPRRPRRESHVPGGLSPG